MYVQRGREQRLAAENRARTSTGECQQLLAKAIEGDKQREVKTLPPITLINPRSQDERYRRSLLNLLVQVGISVLRTALTIASISSKAMLQLDSVELSHPLQIPL